MKHFYSTYCVQLVSYLLPCLQNFIWLLEEIEATDMAILSMWKHDLALETGKLPISFCLFI